MLRDKEATTKANPEMSTLLFQSLISNLNETGISILKADAMWSSERRKGWKGLCFAPFLGCFLWSQKCVPETGGMGGYFKQSICSAQHSPKTLMCLPEFSGGLSMCAVWCLRSECHQDNYHPTVVDRIHKLLSCTGPLCFSDEWTTQFGACVHL